MRTVLYVGVRDRARQGTVRLGGDPTTFCRVLCGAVADAQVRGRWHASGQQEFDSGVKKYEMVARHRGCYCACVGGIRQAATGAGGGRGARAAGARRGIR